MFPSEVSHCIAHIFHVHSPMCQPLFLHKPIIVVHSPPPVPKTGTSGVREYLPTCQASGMYTWLPEDMLRFKWCMFVWRNILPFGFFAMLQVYVPNSEYFYNLLGHLDLLHVTENNMDQRDTNVVCIVAVAGRLGGWCKTWTRLSCLLHCPQLKTKYGDAFIRGNNGEFCEHCAT